MTFSGKSDIGKKRASNQDSFSITKPADNALLCVICDGMGGMNGGNIASDLAMKSFVSEVTLWFKKTPGNDDVASVFQEPLIKTLLETAAEKANQAVLHHAKHDVNLTGMGTTLIAALIIDDMLYVANIGDSRLYLITHSRNENNDIIVKENINIEQFTHDHSYVQYLIDMGQLTPPEAENSPYRNIITRAVGREDMLKTDTYALNLREKNHAEFICEDSYCTKHDDSYILLCSDGLYNYISDDEIKHILIEQSSANVSASVLLDEKVGKLVHTANENGGGDNITVILIKHTPDKDR